MEGERKNKGEEGREKRRRRKEGREGEINKYIQIELKKKSGGRGEEIKI